MRIECNSCHQQLGKHSAAGGIFTILPAGLITGVLCAILTRSIHGWAFVVAVPLWLFLSWVLWELPRWLTSLRYFRRRCPNCGACDWARPNYSGFSL